MELKLKDFEIKNTSLNVTIKDLNKKINNLENQLTKNKDEYEELNENYNLCLNEEKNKNKKLNDTIDQKNKKINLLETNIRNNELKYNGVISNYDDIIKKK
jgi:predicted RNase H-like nuclease (RuvC/YqgF family)